MSNTITINEPNADALSTTYDGIQLERAPTSTAAFALVARLPYVPGQTTYMYVDSAGRQSDWYRSARYTSTSLGPYSDPWPVSGFGGGTTAGELLQELGMRMGDYAEGVVTGASTDTTYLDDATRIEQDRTFNFGWLTYTGRYAGANTGLERRITGYDGIVNVGRFLLGNGMPGSGLAVPAQPGDEYSVHMRWSRRRKLGAINRAIRRLPPGFWRRIEDTSIVTSMNTWTYALPPGMVDVWEVYVQASLTMSGPGALAVGSSGQGYPFNRLRGWTLRHDVEADGTVTHTLQLDSVAPWPRVLRLVGPGVQRVLLNDLDIVAVGQDDYQQRLVEYLLSYANAYLWLEGADGAPVDQAQRSVEMVKLQLQVAAELRNDLVMPQPSLEVDTPYTAPAAASGDNPYWMSALHTPPQVAR